MTSGNASFYWYASLMAATCFLAFCCRRVHVNADFLGEYPGLFPQSALALQWILCGVSLRGLGISNIFYVKVNSYPDVTSWLSLFVNRDRFAQCKLCRRLEIPQ